MKTDVVHGFGGFFILIGFYLAGFVIVYKIVDVVFWLINGHWFGYTFYHFLSWIGFSFDNDYITGWVGLDNLIVDHIIFRSFAYGTMTISGVLCIIGVIFTFIGSQLDKSRD